MKKQQFLSRFWCVFWLFQGLFLSHSFAQVDQDGWTLIRQNDFVAAKSVFLNQLKSNPKDRDALSGLIFIAETVQDYKLYKSYTKALIELDWDAASFALFGHLYESDPEFLLEKLGEESLKARYHLSYADSLFQRRKFKAYNKELRKVMGDFDWSVIGPFANMAGSGFDQVNAVETEAFNPNTTYKNDRDVDLQWVNRSFRAPSGTVDFKSSLPYDYEGTYYANTFITSPNDRKTQLRIARTTPMKIWLDDQLIFEQRENIAYEWDFEIVELELKAGTHRLLVKCAGYFDYMVGAALSLDYNDGVDQGDGYHNKSHNYDYQYQLDRGTGSSVGEFCLRVTDTEGKVFSDINSAFNGVYQIRDYQPEVSAFVWIDHYKSLIEKQANNWTGYYMLAKAFFLYNQTIEGEAFFYPIFQQNEDKVFFRYLLAKFYAANGKSEKAEALISGTDQDKTPFFALMETALTKIDKEKNEMAYLSQLDRLLEVSPTNWGVISNYLDYFGSKGKTAEKKAFIENFLKRFPEEDYKERLKPYLEDDSYKPSSYKALTDKQKDKNAKDALKRKKKRFEVSDYWTLINYYKQQEKNDNVLDLYDELIEIYPYKTYWLGQKAKFLFENDRLDEALAVLSKSVTISEYNNKTFEMMGDIYLEKGNKEEAYSYYAKAKDLLSMSRVESYGQDGLEEKMEKIKAKKSLKEYFQTMSFEDALEDNSWKQEYAGEESVILLYTIESALNEQNVIDYNQKMLIAIQNEAGAKFWTEANFGFLGNISFVKVLKKDGQEISPNRNYGYVVFKNLEPGDIIQIEGNSKADMTGELHGEMYHIAALSHEVPVHHAQLEFIHPADKDLYYTCYRLDCEPETRLEDTYKVLSWEFDKIDKMQREDAILDDLDAYAWIMFSTMESWSDVVDWYLKKTYRRLETNYEIDGALLGIIQEGMSEAEMVEAIYNYLTKEITYSHVGFLNSNYIPKKPSATISDEIGDCKDVASLMIAMLRKMGIEAYYVLVRSSNFTNSKPLPTILAFNHVIVGYILEDGKMRYLDLTTDYYPYYVIPEFDNNSWALIVREGETDVFRLPSDMLDATKTRLEIDIKAQVNADRSLDIRAKTTGTGILGGKLREELNRVTTEDDRRKFLLNYFGAGTFDHLSLDRFGFDNLEDISTPLEMSMEMKSFNYIERVSNFYIVQVPLLNAITTRPTLFNEERYNNLDLNTLFEISPAYQMIELELPPNFTLLELPEDIEMKNEFGSYEMRFEPTPKGLIIKRNFELKKRLIEYADYKAFKDFYLDLLDADRLKIAMKKVVDN